MGQQFSYFPKNYYKKFPVLYKNKSYYVGSENAVLKAQQQKTLNQELFLSPKKICQVSHLSGTPAQKLH